MGIDMATVDAPFGFQPYKELLRANYYVVQTAPTIAFYHGDLVTLSGGATLISTPHFGYMPYVDDANVVATGEDIVGSVIGVFDEDLNPINYMAVGRVGNSTIAGYLLIADHPQQIFVAQEDADGNALDLAEGMSNADAITPALNAGNTSTGRSKYEIDSSTAANTSTLMLRLLGPHPDDTPATDTYWCRWLCMINTHHFGNVGITGITNTG